MNKTNIEWCDYTWNPVTGCLHGCPYCYAKRFAERGLGEYGKYVKGKRFVPNFYPERLEEPLRLKKPSRIFVCSMGDLFGSWVTSGWIGDVRSIVEECPQHTFLFLSKNPARYRDWEWPRNAWIGTSVENQDAAERRIPELLKAQAKVRFLSVEPLLGPIDLDGISVDLGDGLFGSPLRCHHVPYRETREYPTVSWVIVGAQTGPKAIKPDMDWVKSIVVDCQTNGVPVFLKDNLKWPEQIREYPA